MLARLFLKCLSAALPHCYRLPLTDDCNLMTSGQLLFSDAARKTLLTQREKTQVLSALKFMDLLPMLSHVAPLFKVNSYDSSFFFFCYLFFIFNQSHTFSEVIFQPVGDLLSRSASHVRHVVPRRPLFLPNIILKLEFKHSAI